MVSFAFPLMAKVVPVPGMYIEDHLVATYGFKRAREPVEDCLHRLLGTRRVVIERVVECIRDPALANPVQELHDDLLRRVGLDNSIGVRRLLLEVRPTTYTLIMHFSFAVPDR